MTKTPIALLGIDLGKNSCSLASMDATDAVVLRKRMTRDAIVTFATTWPACVIAIKACCGAHFLGRTLAALTHDPADVAGICPALHQGAEDR